MPPSPKPKDCVTDTNAGGVRASAFRKNQGLEKGQAVNLFAALVAFIAGIGQDYSVSPAQMIKLSNHSAFVFPFHLGLHPAFRHHPGAAEPDFADLAALTTHQVGRLAMNVITA